MVDKLEVCKYHLDLLVLEPIPPYKTYSANPLIVYVSNGLWPASLSFQLLNLIALVKTYGLLGGPSLGGQSKKHTAQLLPPLQLILSQTSSL